MKQAGADVLFGAEDKDTMLREILGVFILVKTKIFKIANGLDRDINYRTLYELLCCFLFFFTR